MKAHVQELQLCFMATILGNDGKYLQNTGQNIK